ncbi:DAPG hydrolase family protein [Nocardia sp. NPDC057668]|uniref:DAPG hydrolase family protein n=1 Tax=Nocardia sp. NPDC057668 TaxID=3346202 RepID=UPI00366C0EDE
MSRSTRTSRRRALLLGAAGVGTAATATVAAGTARAEPAAGGRRYPGYQAEDWAKPFAEFMAERTVPAQSPVLTAYDSGPVASEQIPDFAAWTADLAPTGYSLTETGYGYTASGEVWVAVRTEMPRVTAAMWDWWFGWHSTDSARYKLWHPDAHMYSELATDTRARALPDRDRYVGNISYVDEYIGPKLQQLAIAFHDPVTRGFTVPDDHTVICARVGSGVLPVDLGWLAHQVRPVPGGAEMRSRFYLKVYGTHAPAPLPAARAVERGAALDPADLLPDLVMARDLMLHCGQEMNHLARFLPELYARFRDTP